MAAQAPAPPSGAETAVKAEAMCKGALVSEQCCAQSLEQSGCNAELCNEFASGPALHLSERSCADSSAHSRSRALL